MKPFRIQVAKAGGPLDLVSATHTRPGANEVLIRVKAVGLNPIDWKHAYLGTNVASWPASLGNELAGVVDEVGPNVNRFKYGDEVLARVYPTAAHTAAFQSMVVAQVSHVAQKPAGMSFQEACAVPMGFMTAASTIYQGLKISPLNISPVTAQQAPKSILIIGGSSIVGAAAIQLLRLTLPDASIFATCAVKHHDRVKALGATAAFDSRAQNVVDQVRDTSPGQAGVDAILDAVNGVALAPELLQLLTGPRLFAELATGENVKDIPAGVRHTLTFGRSIMSTEIGSKLFAALEPLLEQGSYEVPLPITVVGEGLTSVETGLQTLRAGISGTKLVVDL